MRDTVVGTGHPGFTTNQPKGVSLYATEACVPLFSGTMMELDQLGGEDGNISVELWVETEALVSDIGLKAAHGLINISLSNNITFQETI